MRGLVLYVCVSAVCTLGILQNNGLFLALQMCYSQNNMLNVPLFNTNQQITLSSTCRARRIHGAVQIIVEMANILCDCSDSPDADIVSTYGFSTALTGLESRSSCRDQTLVQEDFKVHSLRRLVEADGEKKTSSLIKASQYYWNRNL